MELKNGYKQTEVGVIPEDWEVKAISDFSRQVRGGSPRPAGSPKFFNGSCIPWLTVAALTNIPSSQIYVSETETFLTEEGSKYSRTLEIDTLIIANSGATLGVAKLLSMKCCANDGIAALLDFNKSVDKIYIVHCINSITKILREVVATGNGQPNLNTELIGNIKLALPPTCEEQTAIATALSDIDALISRLETLIAKKRAIKQGAMQQLLKPKEGWEVKTYGEVFDILSTATYSRAELTTHDEVGYVHYGDIHTQWNFTLDIQQVILPSVRNEQVKGYTFIKEGDIIMADASEDYSGIGKSVEVKNLNGKKIIAGLHTFLLRDSKNILVNGFKAYLHVTPFIKKQFDEFATGMKVYGVSKNNLTNVQIPVPPKAEQKRIAQILSDMDDELAGLEQKLAKYRLVKQGMMQELLTGKTRLV